jgi:hypothetical protein
MISQMDASKAQEPVNRAGRKSLLLKTTLVGAGLLMIGAHELAACDCTVIGTNTTCNGNVCMTNADGGCTCNFDN